MNFAQTLGLLLLLLLLLLICSTLAGFERVRVTHKALCIHYPAESFFKYKGNAEYYCFLHEIYRPYYYYYYYYYYYAP